MTASAQSPPSGIPRQLFGLMFSRKLFASLSDGIKPVRGRGERLSVVLCGAMWCDTDSPPLSLSLQLSLPKVVMKLRVSVFIVNFIAGGASVGSALVLAPTW